MERERKNQSAKKKKKPELQQRANAASCSACDFFSETRTESTRLYRKKELQDFEAKTKRTTMLKYRGALGGMSSATSVFWPSSQGTAYRRRKENHSLRQPRFLASIALSQEECFCELVAEDEEASDLRSPRRKIMKTVKDKERRRLDSGV